MIRYLLLITGLTCAMTSLQAQLFSAGPDTTICSGTGIELGDPMQTIPTSWCITWTPAEGLDDPHSAHPHASPKNTTTYVATVLTDDWQSISTDDVEITVGFGGLKFTPPYLNQGSDETSQAEVTINPGNDEVTWSFEGNSLGCSIDPETGVITPGTEYGTITILATKTQDPGCYAKDMIDINEGVKELIARDFTHPGRVAKDGVDTLYLVGESQYAVTAIPNASGFSPGAPIWYSDNTPDAIVPADGEILVTGSVSTEHHFTAGSEEAGFKPRVIIKHLNSDEFVLDLTPLFTNASNKLNALNNKLKEKVAKKYPAVPNLTVNLNMSGATKFKRSQVEKYNDPGFGHKYGVEVGGTLSISGKLFHPYFTRVIDLGFFDILLGSELYIEPYFEGTLTGLVNKDESKEDPGWTFVGNPVKATITGGVRAAFNLIGQSSGYQIEGGFAANAEINIDLTFYVSNGELRMKFTLAPLQGNTKITANRYIDPKKKWTFFDYTVDLLDKWVSEDYLLFDFGAQN